MHKFLLPLLVLSIGITANAQNKKLDLAKLLAAGKTKDAQVTFYNKDSEGYQIYSTLQYKPPIVYKNYDEFRAAQGNGELPWRKVVLGKGLVRVNQLEFCHRHFGPVVEGSGPETILINDAFYSEKDTTKKIELMEKSGCVLRNLTVVNLQTLATTGGFTHHYVNVYFAGTFSTNNNPTESNFRDLTFTCQGCVFDSMEFGGLEKKYAVIAGSVLWDESQKKYQPMPNPNFNPTFTKYFEDLQKKHANGGIAPGDTNLARSALINILSIKRNNVGTLLEDPFAKGLNLTPDNWQSDEYFKSMVYLLTEQYGLQSIAKPEVLSTEQLFTKINAELKSNRPLSAMVYAGRFPDSITSQEKQKLQGLFAPSLKKLSAKYGPCNLTVDYSKEFLTARNLTKSQDFKEKRASGGTAYEILRDDFAYNLQNKLPFLFLPQTSSSKCSIAVQITDDTFSSWVDDERTIGQHQEIDWEGALAADRARSSARDAGLKNFSAGMQAGFQSMEKTWTTFRDTRTHFDKHVGGTDLVSYQVKNATNPGAAQDAIAAERDALSSGSSDLGMKTAEHELATYKKVAKANFTGTITTKVHGKKDITTELKPIQGQWTLNSCSVKNYLGGGEIKAVNEAASTCKEDLQGGEYGGFMYNYSKTNIHPYVERYVDENLVKSVVQDYQTLYKNKSADQKAEAILLLRLFGVNFEGKQLIEVLERFKTATAENDFVRGAGLATGAF